MSISRTSPVASPLIQRIVTMALAVVFLATLACHGDKRLREATPVEVATVALSDGSAQTLRYSAAIKPDQQVDLAFRVGGYIEQLRTQRGVDGRMRIVQEGDLVQRGDVLARVRQADYRDKVTQGSAIVDEARAGYEQAKRDFDRAEALFATKSITRPEYDVARARFDGAAARLRQARAGSNDATLAMNDANLASPISGVVLKRNVELGNLVSPGSAAFVIADMRRVKVVFGVPDVLVEGVRPGSSVEITTEALRGAKFTGTVTRVSPSADAKSRVFEVEVTIPNPNGVLKSGMVASIQLLHAGTTPQSATTIPLASIVRSGRPDSEFAVFVLERSGNGEVVRSRSVKLGDTSGNMIAVTSGLRPGERVVTRGAALLSDGESVRVQQ
jgi:multidrug efflux system membrane fusion protein